MATKIPPGEKHATAFLAASPAMRYRMARDAALLVRHFPEKIRLHAWRALLVRDDIALLALAMEDLTIAAGGRISGRSRPRGRPKDETTVELGGRAWTRNELARCTWIAYRRVYPEEQIKVADCAAADLSGFSRSWIQEQRKKQNWNAQVHRPRE